MKTYRKIVEDQTYFVIAEVEPALHNALHGLYYQAFEDGFAKAFPNNAPHLDRIYENFTRYAPEMILQAARYQPVPWENCLRSLLEIIEGQGFEWGLVGSAALAARGLPVQPRDLDLIVENQASPRFSELLLDYMIEPLTESKGWVGDWFGRAFLQARLEWIGDVSVDPAQVVDYRPDTLESIVWQGCTLYVPPLKMQLAVCEQRGLMERANLIRQAMS